MIGRLVKLNPAAILFGLNAVLNMAVAWGWHPRAGVVGAIGVIATGAITILNAIATRPVGLQLIIGAVGTMAVAFGAFGIHLSADWISSTTAVLSIILAGYFHLAHTPVAQFRKGTTAEAVERAAVSR